MNSLSVEGSLSLIKATPAMLPNDLGIVRSVMAHPKVWPWIHDDFAPPVEQFIPQMRPDIFYLLLHTEDKLAGLFMIVWQNTIMAEVHTCLLPEFWGKAGLECAKAGIEYMFTQTPCEKLITYVPSDNGQAERYSTRNGFMEEGNLTQAFVRNEKLLDMKLFGLTKDSWEASCQQPQ